MTSVKVTGPGASTALGEVVGIPVPLMHPYGILLEPATPDGKCLRIKAWERMPNGRTGPIQRHRGVMIGDVLIAVNDNSLHDTPFDECMKIVKSDNLLKKTLYFATQTELSKRRGQHASYLHTTRQISRPSGFFSEICKARVHGDGNGKQHAEYEIACRYRTLSSQLHKETTYKWSLWKRYSEFEELDTAMRRNYHQMSSIIFPPKNSFTINKLSKTFIDTRMELLKEYWKQILNVDMDRITDFAKHHCSEDLKRFLECDTYLHGNTNSSGRDDEGIEGQEYFDSTGENRSVGGPTPTKRTVKRVSAVNSRTRSLRTKSPLKQSDSIEHVYKPPPPITSQGQSQPQSKALTVSNTDGESSSIQSKSQQQEQSTAKTKQSSTPSSSSISTPSKTSIKSTSASAPAEMPPAPPGRNALLADIAKRRID